MLYEDMTSENITERSMARVAGSVDKREGAIIYDAVAPSSAELAILYMELGSQMDRVFPDTQGLEDLIKKAKERSVIWREATFAVRKGYFEDANGGALDIEIGKRFTGGPVNYTTTERIAPGQFRLRAETPGVIGNQHFGNLIPIDHIDGLAVARLEDILVHGEDDEDVESLRQRYFASLESQAFGGNVADYKDRVTQIQGVGAAKVFPTFAGGYRPADLQPPAGADAWIAGLAGGEDMLAWIKRVYAMISEGVVTVGAGTVRISLISSDWTVPSDVLIDEVQTKLDPIQNNGEGVGIAPINHSVAVRGVEGVTINVAFTLHFETGFDWESVEDQVREAIRSYFTELSQTWDVEQNLVVRVAQIETKVLNVPGIIDVRGTTINGATANLSLEANEIPVLGVITNAAT